MESTTLSKTDIPEPQTQRLTKVNLELHRKFRNVVTGDEDKPVRLWRHEESGIRAKDKFSFLLGVTNFVILEAIILGYPEYFPYWYGIVYPICYMVKIIEYVPKKWGLFLVDFCPFMNVVLVMMTYYGNPSDRFFKALLTSSMSITHAVWLWKNSVVFHDFDRMSSFYMHICPLLLLYTMRFSGENPVMGGCAAYDVYDLFCGMGLYLFWQAAHYICIMKGFCKDLVSNPEYYNSLRSFVSEPAGIAESVRGICVKYGFFHADEQLHAESTKTQIVFMVSQFCFTFVFALTTPLLFHSSMLTAGLLCFCFCVALFNGATFYIEVFSKKYEMQFDQSSSGSSVASDRSTRATDSPQSQSSLPEPIHW